MRVKTILCGTIHLSRPAGSMQAMAATPGCECAAVLLMGAQVSTQLVARLLLLPVCYGCHPNPCMHTIWSHNTPTSVLHLPLFRRHPTPVGPMVLSCKLNTQMMHNATNVNAKDAREYRQYTCKPHIGLSKTGCACTYPRFVAWPSPMLAGLCTCVCVCSAHVLLSSSDAFLLRLPLSLRPVDSVHLISLT